MELTSPYATNDKREDVSQGDANYNDNSLHKQSFTDLDTTMVMRIGDHNSQFQDNLEKEPGKGRDFSFKGYETYYNVIQHHV